LTARRQGHLFGGFFPGYFFGDLHPKVAVARPNQLNRGFVEQEFAQGQLQGFGAR
jgi:hypothetical protein